jgi:hypothetical protein
MSKRDCYEVLGVSKSADEQDIKKAYRKNSRKPARPMKSLRTPRSGLRTTSMAMPALIRVAAVVASAVVISATFLAMCSVIFSVVAAEGVVEVVLSVGLIYATLWIFLWRMRSMALRLKSAYPV